MPRIAIRQALPQALLAVLAFAAAPLVGAAVPGKTVEPSALQCAPDGPASGKTRAVGAKPRMVAPAIACGATMLDAADGRRTDGRAPLRAWSAPAASAAPLPVAL